MTINVTIQAQVKKGSYGELNKFLEVNLPNVRGFLGALSISVLFNAETHDFLLFEEWESQTHHGSYIQAITGNGVLAELADFFTAEPMIKYYNKQDI